MFTIITAYQFFHNLNPEGVEITLDEYVNNKGPSADRIDEGYFWKVTSLTQDELGFNLLLERHSIVEAV